jgi:ABC-type lipoprotein export system ATPase subunit
VKEIPLLAVPYRELLESFPYAGDFFEAAALTPPPGDEAASVSELFRRMDGVELEQKGIDPDRLADDFLLFMENMRLRGREDRFRIRSVTVLGGRNKSGAPEEADLTLRTGDVLSVVGATGSGKSRLLADIEWIAQRDTPTGRQILINGAPPPAEWRFSIEHKLVAQLSQNMNFVMDLTVDAFIQMHAESRVIGNIEEKKQLILREANKLAGEPLMMETPVTALSGGQSRALMIADTAFLSGSPIVLIDEIENAGIDRKTAVELLIRREKIVVIATHDPVLALMAHRRIVVKNGGIHKVVETSPEEKVFLRELEEMNAKLMNYREKLRSGERLAP